MSIQDFKDYYWCKDELVSFCRTEDMDTRGSKLELAARIEQYLMTGEKISYKGRSLLTSKFDWSTETLNTKTIITDNYKNTENVRTFFREQIGERFKFNVKFMDWMKAAQGKNLGDAVEMWKQIISENAKDNLPKDIAPQFEYNTYIRDFMKDNPQMTMKDAIKYWKSKKLKPGDNKYSSADIA